MQAKPQLWHDSKSEKEEEEERERTPEYWHDSAESTAPGQPGPESGKRPGASACLMTELGQSTQRPEFVESNSVWRRTHADEGSFSSLYPKLGETKFEIQ